nr:MAG TPA: hypothetical protein [Caudoviricetes sp.]
MRETAKEETCLVIYQFRGGSSPPGSSSLFSRKIHTIL